MSRQNYSGAFKSEVVIELLRGEKEIGALAKEHNINPNVLRNWRKEFLEKASRVFDESRREKELSKKEEQLEAEQERLYKTIGQLTIERDFLRQCGKKLIGEDFEERYRRKIGGTER